MNDILCKILCPIILAIAFLFNTVGNWAGVGDIIPTEKCPFGCEDHPTVTEETTETTYPETTYEDLTNGSDIITEPSTEESSSEPVTDPVTEPSTEEPSSEPVTDPVTEPSTEEPSSEPVTEPVTEPSTEEPSTGEPTTEPSTESTTKVTTTSTTTETGPRTKSVTEKNFAGFGGTGTDVFNGADGTSDGGFVAVGTTTSKDGDLAEVANGAWGEYYSFIVKYASDSSVEWVRSLGSINAGIRLEDVAVLSDGSIVAVGYTSAYEYAAYEENEYSLEAIIVKYSADGELLWKKSVGGKRSDMFYCVSKTGNGFVVGGKSDSIDGSFEGIGDAIVVRAIIMNYDFDGNILWNRYLEGEYGASIDGISADSDNSVFVTCVTASATGSFASIEGMGKGYVDTAVIKYDYAGEFQWSYAISGTNKETFTTIAADGEGGCVVGGYYELMNNYEPDGALADLHYCGGIDAVGIRLNADGTRKWIKTISGYNDDFIYDVVKTGDGGFVFVGNTTSGNREFADVGNCGENDGFVYFVTRGGNAVSVLSQGGARNDMAMCAAYTTTGGLMAFGQTVSSDGKFAGMNSHITDAFIQLFGTYYTGYTAQYKLTIKNY